MAVFDTTSLQSRPSNLKGASVNPESESGHNLKPEATPSVLNSLKRKNRREVLKLIRHASPISIADIAEQTQLSKVTVTKILDHYRRLHLVNGEKSEGGEERGKRPQIFTINPDFKFLFCVKMDGYTMLATLTDIRGRIIASHTALYDQRIELAQLIKCIADAFFMLVEREGKKAEDCLAIVAGLHGIINPDTGICYLTPQFPNWGKNIPLKEMLLDILPDGVPLYLDNWVHHFARGEATVLPPSITRFMLISTEVEGINGALIVNGKFFRGYNCLSGEIGHMIVDTTPGAEVCQCGGKGCFEAAASPRRMVARVRESLKLHPDSLLHDKLRQPEHISFGDILGAANAGDTLAQSELTGAARHFAIAIRNIMQTCDPELVIIEGEYAAAGEFFLQELRRNIPRTSLVDLDKTVQIRYTTQGQFGAIIGAAQFALDLFFAEI